VSNIIMVVVLPDPAERWGRRGTSRRPNSWATPQGLDLKVKNGSSAKDGAPERLRCETIQKVS